MLRDFRTFARLIAAQFAAMSVHELFRVDISGDHLWQSYLDAFPPGTNPIYRVRTEHDGSYDRSFVRRFGNVVAIVNGKIQTIWDVNPDILHDHAYREVCATMAAIVRGGSIVSVFREWEQKLGRVSSTEKMDSGLVHTWYHFHAEVARKHLVPRGKVDEVVGDLTTKLGVFTRGICEIEPHAVNAVLDLIDANSLYRGAEFKNRLVNFTKLLDAYGKLAPPPARDRELWLAHTFATQPWDVTLIRNSVIGTLLVDLSEGKELEDAVKAYEQKVAPANYRRTTALVTQRMIDDANKALEQLGLHNALARRHATLRDINVNDVIWADRSAQTQMKEGLSALVAPTATVGKHSSDKATDITIDEFVSKILPDTTGIEILFSNRLVPNLVSITTAADPQAPSLFRWDSPFAWTYNGDVTDSITERVKAAGGNIDAQLRVSLAWFNHDDLDLHSNGPQGHIFYMNPAGVLDVDMHRPGGRLCLTPVENQSWQTVAPGHYRFIVHNYSTRAMPDGGHHGCTVQLAINGDVSEYSYPKAIPGDKRLPVFEFDINSRGKIENLKVNDEFTGGALSQSMWGLKTETFVKVDTLMLSPNHWDGRAVGNKHWFFLVNNARNDAPARGLYNEFLRTDLDKHRKVFELVGAKTKVAPSDDQLSGLGFSSTKPAVVTVRLEHKRGRPLFNIHF